MRVLVLVLLLLAPASALALPEAEPPEPPTWRDAQPVVILGAQLPGLSVVARYVERPPAPFEDETQGDGLWLPLPALPTEDATPVDAIGVFRWDESAGFVRVPAQVDERFVRYLTNYASGFGIYSQADMELTYAFDAEGTRRIGELAGAPDIAAFPAGEPITTPDPVAGFDSDDELVFLARDAGPRAASAEGYHEVRILDPWSDAQRFVYVARAAPASFAAQVTYARDADADVYVQSNHGDYGGAPGGVCHPGDGVDAPFGPTQMCDHRRPKDSATVTGATYAFHYAGRWKLDAIEVGGVDLVDRWKGRAFQQAEGNAANIGGFEDENDWTRSSVTLGERVGPIRVIRETWGSDSGTSVTRTDVFYPERIEQRYIVRVHPVPPDGVYAFWDHRAGAIDTYYTSLRPAGVAIDGVNDELYGTNSEWQQDALGTTYFAIDAPDPTLSGLVANVAWDQVTGPHGTILTHILAPDTRSGALTPYYRDDAAFDDGTGDDPGSWGARGIHFFVTSDTDNAFLPAPVNEFRADVVMRLLPGRMPNVGESFAASERAPLLAASYSGLGN